MSTLTEFDAPPSKQTAHPRGLYVLFGAEMWERFSYYGMRALLTLYLTTKVGLTKDQAGLIYGTYTSLVYLTPLLGGFLADRFLGQRKAILIGGIVMAMGHFAMAFEPLLYLAMTLLIIGNGFFKANISTMVGNLYPRGDSRRDGAYTIFYMGINLGAFFSPLVCSKLRDIYGYHYGFGAAGVGMVLGLFSFLMFQRFLVGGYPPGREDAGKARLTFRDFVEVALISALCLGVACAIIYGWPTVRPYWESGGIFSILAAAALAIGGLFAVVNLTARPTSAHGPVAPGEEDPDAPLDSAQWQRIAVIVVASLFSVIFWAGFEQAGSTLTHFANEKTERTILGWSFPPEFYQSVNPCLIFLLAPLFSILWTGLDRTRFRLPSVAKLGTGLLWVGLAYVIMYAAENKTEATGKVGPFWLAAVYLFLTVGELCLSPVGLSLVNKLAPAKVASLMMAVWFLGPFIGNFFGGTLDAILNRFHINIWVFLILIPSASGLLLLVLTPLLRKMAHGRD